MFPNGTTRPIKQYAFWIKTEAPSLGLMSRKCPIKTQKCPIMKSL